MTLPTSLSPSPAELLAELSEGASPELSIAASEGASSTPPSGLPNSPSIEPAPLPPLATADELQAQLAPHRERYQALLAAGQPSGWRPDGRTLDCWCLAHLLDERWSAVPLSDERRRELGHAFHRMVRSAEDLWLVAAQVQLMGDHGLPIETYSGDYWTARNHGKWG